MSTFVLLASQYKGGSTLLMRVLNNFPGVQISGENSGAFASLMEFYGAMKNTDSIKHTQDFVDLQLGKPSWYNQFNLMKIKNDIKNLIFNIYKSESMTHFGFKEIRFGANEDYDRMEKTFKLLKEIIPELKLVLLTRKRNFIDNEHDIDYLKNDRISTEDEYENQFQYFRRFASENPSYSYVIDYSELASIPAQAQVINLFNFLGIEFYNVKFDEVMKFRL